MSDWTEAELKCTHETSLRWRPGGAQGVACPLVPGAEIVAAIFDEIGWWNAVTLYFDADGYFYRQDASYGGCWSQVEWYIPLDELTLPVPTNDSMARLLSRCAKLINSHGPDSPEVTDFIEAYSSKPGFAELANLSRKVKKAIQL